MLTDAFCDAILKLYPSYHKVYGPYKRGDSRSIIILYDGKKSSARQFAKVKLEVSLGRRLKRTETVDHIDDNVINDGIDNLQILSRKENIKKSSKHKDKSSICPNCEEKFTRKRIEQKFCSRSCSGKFNFGDLGSRVGNGR